VVVEMIEQDKLAVYHEITEVVDNLLRGIPATPEIRFITADGAIERVSSATMPRMEEQYESAWGEYQGYVEEMPATRLPRDKQIYIYPYGVARNKLERAIGELGLNAVMARHLEDADVIITVKQQERRDAARLEEAVRNGIPVHVIRSNTYQQILGALHELYRLDRLNVETEAIHEARAAINEVMSTSRPVELTPRNAYLRRLQHKIANQFHLSSESVGTEPARRVRISK